MKGIRIKPKTEVVQPPPPPPPSPPKPISGIAIKKPIAFTGSNSQAVKYQYDRFKEAKSEMEDEYENIFVLPYKDEMGIVHPEILRVYIRGRKNQAEDDNAFFTGKYLKCRIEFRENYPANPPKFYVEKLKNGEPFRSMNVYNDGEVCQYTLNPEYWKEKRYDLCTILSSVEKMLYAPNSSDPANLIMQEMFLKDEEEYWWKQAEQAKFFYTEADYKTG